MNNSLRIPVGIYEKALPDDLSWEQRLETASSVGYDFVEISIDESEERLERLNWSPSERVNLRNAISNTGVPILTMGVSALRKFALGSASKITRESALENFFKAIELASDIGVRIIQVIGYDVFYETSNDYTRMWFLESLRKGAQKASEVGVMLGLENADVESVNSVEKVMQFVREVNSPWFNVYPDMGNLVASGFDPINQILYAKDHIVAIHVKDAVPGEFRGVHFESGDVPFKDVFQTLAGIGFWGPMVVEMWVHFHSDDDVLELAIQARKLVDQLILSAWGQKVATQ